MSDLREKLEGRVVVSTGASGGLGRETALQLAAARELVRMGVAGLRSWARGPTP